MKQIVSMTILVLLVVLGISFLMFAIRMIWFPPGRMGMMMDQNMIGHQMFSWFGHMFWVLMIFVGIIILIWTISMKKSDK